MTMKGPPPPPNRPAPTVPRAGGAPNAPNAPNAINAINAPSTPGAPAAPGAAHKAPGQPAKRRATFEDLLDALIRDGLLPVARRAPILQRKDTQLAAMVRQRLVEARLASGGGAAPPQAERGPAISPVELFLNFHERDTEDRPIREDAVTEAWARLIGFPYVKLDPLKLDAALSMRFIAKPFARKHGFLAIDERDGVLTIACYDPFDIWALEKKKRVTNKKLSLVIASKGDVERLITDFYGFRQSVQRAEEQIVVGMDLGNLDQFVRMKSEQEIEASDEHVVHAVDYILRYAFGQLASDIHIEPKRSDSLVRYRIDGSLHAVSRLPKVVHNAVVNRIKTLSRLDISEKRRPQDGRLRTEHNGRSVEMRVSTMPVAFGEKVVLRIFDPAIVHDDLSALGFFERDSQVFQELISLPHGILLVTGPTGSGKTTTLYTALRKLATEDVNITTIEDPIEMVFEGINQTAVNMAINLGFAECLRTILRQDPDIVMVGEIRDLETAKHAIQAALTGHLVFSTLHTNDAASAISRLVDLGVQDFLLATTLAGVMAQRLVKKICQACVAERVLTTGEAEALALDTSEGDILVRYGTGCVDCRKTGYKGRSAVIELFKVTPTIRRLIHDRAGDAVIKEQARREGMLTLREAAIKKMLLGETTYEQVVEVTTEV